MSVQDIVVAIVVALISVIGTMLATRKNQIVKNTEAIKNLTRQLGIDDKETLMHGLYSQYESLRESIGRGEKASLTEQHMHLEKCMQNGQKMIEEKYKKEDAAYALFTARERDLADTMSNFTREYKETINERNRLAIENEELKERMQTLLIEKNELSQQSKEKIKALQNENKMLMEKLIGRERDR